MSMQRHIAEGFPGRLKEARLAAGMSQRELAFPGCTAVYICRIERGDRTPSQQVAEELARRAGVNAHWLLTGEGTPEPVLVLRLALPAGRAPATLDDWLLAEVRRAAEGAAASMLARYLDADEVMVGLS